MDFKNMTPAQIIRAKYKPGCICQGIPLFKILKAIESGKRTYADISKMTGIGGGSCGGKRCGRLVEQVLAGEV